MTGHHWAEAQRRRGIGEAKVTPEREVKKTRLGMRELRNEEFAHHFTVKVRLCEEYSELQVSVSPETARKSERKEQKGTRRAKPDRRPKREEPQVMGGLAVSGLARAVPPVTVAMGETENYT